MELRLRAGYEETAIYIPQQNQNVVGKFIDARLYPHLYKLYPSLFEVIETKKTKKVNDILINNNTDESNITEQ